MTIAKFEELIDEQNKLLDVFRHKLDQLEQETIPQLKAENEALRDGLMDIHDFARHISEEAKALLTGGDEYIDCPKAIGKPRWCDCHGYQYSQEG